MGRFIEGYDRSQPLLLPAYVEDYVSQESLVRVVDAFVETLDLTALGCLLYTSPSPRDLSTSRMPSSA